MSPTYASLSDDGKRDLYDDQVPPHAPGVDGNGSAAEVEAVAPAPKPKRSRAKAAAAQANPPSE